MGFQGGRSARGLAAVLIVAVTLIAATVSPAQQASPSPAAAIKVSGEVQTPLALTTLDIAALPHQSVTVADTNNRRELYQGVPVFDLLRRAGAPLGSQLRGPKMRLYVLVKARDGYAAVFALPEFDPGFTNRVIILADQRHRHALDSVEGPLRIIVPGEKRHARWVRQVTDIVVLSAK